MVKLTERLERTLGKTALTDNSSAEHQLAFDVCKAVDSARYNFGLEPVHTLLEKNSSTLLPMEYLLRPSGNDGNTLNLAQGLNVLRGLGLSSMFDMAVIPRAIEQAMSYGDMGLPVSVNIAPESMNDSLFLTELGSYLSNLKVKLDNPADVVLEIPFTGHTTAEAQAWMRQVQEMGYRIAVDNFGKFNPIETDTVGRIKPSFVKVEGSIIHDALNGVVGAPSNLRQLVEGVRRTSPESQIIAPWVATVEQAKRLHQVYSIDAVQGRELPKDRNYFASQWAFMAYGQAKEEDIFN